MARAIERIERDIAALKEAIGAIALQLQTAYASYLASLGVTLQKQLILATYHLCTQGYPENFLNLSLNQRQQLQQAIRKLSQVAAKQLVAYINSEEVGEDEEDEEVGGDEQDEEAGGDEEVGVDEEENTSLSPSFPDTSNPIELAKWQQNIEDITQEILKKSIP